MGTDPPRVLSDRYELQEEIGRGGSGRVLRAHDRRLDRPVAVKVLSDLRLAAVDRFRREASVAARVQHPNVVPLHDAAVDGELPYLVMRLIEGPSLAERVQEHGPLGPDDAVRLARDLFSGVAATHDAGVLHRDLTPRNVLFDTDGSALIADFGIARGVDDPTLTAANTVLGTRPYVAPERLQGHDATIATDLFAVGVTLRYAATGSHGTPVPGDHPLAEVVQACTDADPAARPGSAAAAADRVTPRRGPEAELPPTRAMPVPLTTGDRGTSSFPDATTPHHTPTDDGAAQRARDRPDRGVMVAVVIVLVVLAAFAAQAVRDDATTAPAEPAATEATSSATPSDVAPTFDPADPAGSARRLAEWLRQRDG